MTVWGDLVGAEDDGFWEDAATWPEPAPFLDIEDYGEGCSPGCEHATEDVQ